MGIPMGIPTGFPQDSYGDSHGDSHRIPMGMGWEWERKFHSHGNRGERAECICAAVLQQLYLIRLITSGRYIMNIKRN